LKIWQFYGRIVVVVSTSTKKIAVMEANIIYLIKIKGKAKIPDYVQVRDKDFTLIGYYRPGRNERSIRSMDLSAYHAEIEALIAEIPFGKITPFELNSHTSS
jgi:hypothetical protein